MTSWDKIVGQIENDLERGFFLLNTGKTTLKYLPLSKYL